MKWNIFRDQFGPAFLAALKCRDKSRQAGNHPILMWFYLRKKLRMKIEERKEASTIETPELD